MKVLLDIVGSVATITLNRPEALNSADLELLRELAAALDSGGADDSVRAVVITGAARAFCAGQDLAALGSVENVGDEVLSIGWNPVIEKIIALSKPVIAAVNGAAAGAGMSLALACDIRIAADNAKFIMAFTKVGVIPDAGSTWTLQRLVGPAKALELALTGTPVKAEEAFTIGLVNQVVPADELLTRSHELAEQLAAGPTLAYALTKRAIFAASQQTLTESLKLEAELQNEAGKSLDYKEAVDAFLSKRTPTFVGK